MGKIKTTLKDLNQINIEVNYYDRLLQSREIDDCDFVLFL